MAIAEIDPAVNAAYTDLKNTPTTRAHHVPGDFYSSLDIYEREKERVFMRDWLCVARAEEIENPGDFMALRIMGEPIVVTRDNSSNLNAFANVCRHRGVEVAVGSGNTEEFSCPYHGWLYDLQGKLVGAPYMKEAEGFKPVSCRLTPINLDVWQGWVFVNFDPDCAPLADFVQPFEEDFGSYRYGDLRLAAKIQFDFDCNWKLVVENAMDNYHINTLHKETLGVGVETRELDIDLRPRGGYRMFYDHEPRAGGGTWFGRKLPWLQDEPDTHAGAGFMAPNFQTFTYVDNVEVLTYWPMGIDKCRFFINILFPSSFFDLPNFADRIEAYCALSTKTVEEDRTMVISLQSAMSSDLFAPGRMAQIEANIHHLINHHIDRLWS